MENQVMTNNDNLLVSLSSVATYKDIDGELILQSYLDDLKTENTRKQYGRAIREWYNFLCIQNNLERVTLQDLKVSYNYATTYMKTFNKQRENGEIKTSTYNSKIKGVRGFYEWLRLQTTIVDNDFTYILHNPFDAVELMEEQDNEGSFALTPDDIKLMLNQPYGNTAHIRERNLLIFELALTTGLRNDTLLGLKMDEIQEIENCFVIDKLTKGHKQTMKPITNYYERLMEWYKYDLPNRARDNGTIFNLHPVTANEMIKKWVSKVGIKKKITFHGLRASCAILIYHTNGGNEYGVQSFLDHSEVEVTKGYLHKEDKIDHSGENAMKSLTDDVDFREVINGIPDEKLRDFMCKLDLKTQLEIRRMIKGA